jgi:hypothetical protein
MITPALCAVFFDHSPFAPFIRVGLRPKCLSLATAAYKRQLRDI